MKKGKYIWMNGKFVKWNDAKVHVLTHALHYGGSVYEGIRVYPVREGRKVVPTIFRLDDHLKRFVNSMADIEMKPVPVARLRKVIMELVKKNGIKDGYIRPIAFYGYERLGIYWEGLPVQISIAAMPWGVYLPKEMKLKTSKWRRLSPDSVKIEAKVGGYYINSNYATASVKGQADEALLLDHDGFIAEAACANIFFVKGKTLYTPKRGTILPGLTRDSIIELARSFGFKTVEKKIRPSEIAKFDEAFTTGTATEVTAVVKIDNKKIGNGKVGDVTAVLKDGFSDLVRGQNVHMNKAYKKWFHKIY
ncbi:branched-chain amino acid transaminase [Candidatus Peregrinibacteria bacterium]|jgi:branched-chain amino acid aminotransferase|nr:branched-chain amino acid transaminase [Candidatus Peregrinibacteria bacterium]MBT4148153.1 branched-chain amino acid transaminase [Candidatus Peregrinibacteria bacterium]MBT4366640.1 branched-chain amino acid transaminase [Candidatus Peregrinibacteria bacterium]